MLSARLSRTDIGPLMARLVLVLSPALAFGAFRLGGSAPFVMVLPLVVMVVAYARTPGARVPVWECALLSVLTLSAIWSDVPVFSVERLRVVVPMLAAVVVAGRLLPAEAIMKCLRAAFLIVIVTSIFVLVTDPSTRSRSFSSDLVFVAQFPKNTYGGLLAFSLLLTLSRPRRLNALIVPVLVTLLVLNQSVTAWVVATVGSMAVVAGRYIVTRQSPRVSKTALATLLVSVTGGTALSLLLLSDSALAVVDKDPSLGSRTETWAACWEQILNAPLLGHGAYAFLDSGSNSPVTQAVWATFDGYRPPHPHNGLLDLWGQLGLLGVLVFAGMMLHGLRRAARVVMLPGQAPRTAALGLLFVLLFGLTEPTYLGPWLVVTFACLAVVDNAAAAADPRAPLEAPRGEAMDPYDLPSTPQPSGAR